MSVLLINPRLFPPSPARLLTPPLGLAYLVASLKASGIPTWLLDADALDYEMDQVVDFVRKLKPTIIGVTAMTPTVESAYRLLKLLRPMTQCLVLGGPHVSALGPPVFDDCSVDLEAAFCGEAEQAFPLFVKKIMAHEKITPGEIPGLLLPGQTNSISCPRIENLDQLPFPDRWSLPLHRYRHPLFAGQPITTLLTSRGCPYRCIFCDKSVSGSRWRPRSPENVLAEISEIVLKSGLRRIIIYDDLFTLDRQRVIAICQGLIQRDLRVRWKCEGRVNRVDPEMLSWMKQAGCEMVAYGVETANEKGLAFLRKDITISQAREAFAMTRAAGIKTLAYFLLGIPGETLEDEKATVELALELEADYAQFGVLAPFPGTELYEVATSHGWLEKTRGYAPAERGYHRPVIRDGYWTPEKLEEIVRFAHRRFYFRFSYLRRRIGELRSFRELWAQARQGVQLARWYLKKEE